MAKMDDAAIKRPHGLTLENRERAVITGVEHVESFDEGLIVLDTHGGRLTITGMGMHVESLQPEQEKMTVSGRIAGCLFDEGKAKRGRGFIRQALGR